MGRGLKNQLLAVAVLCLLAASGCGGTSAKTQSKPTVTVTLSDSASPTASFSPNVGSDALRVGQTREGADYLTTVERIRYPYPPAEYRTPERGKSFFGIYVKQCLRPSTSTNPSDDVSTYNGDFYVESPNGDQFAGSGDSWNDWPEPKFPESVSFGQKGKCLHGWIVLEVPSGTKVVRVGWRPDQTATAEWLP